MAILKPAAEQTAVELVEDTEAIEDDAVAVDAIDITGDVTVMDEMPVTPIHTVYIIDDTVEVSAYITDAPMSPSGQLSFVNQAKTARAARMDIALMDEYELSLLELFEAEAA